MNALGTTLQDIIRAEKAPAPTDIDLPAMVDATLLPESIVKASLAERKAYRAYIGCEPAAIRDNEHAWMMKAVELAALVSHHVTSGSRSC
jgi:hypothetical protein